MIGEIFSFVGLASSVFFNTQQDFHYGVFVCLKFRTDWIFPGNNLMHLCKID